MAQKIILKNGLSANLGTLTLTAGEAAFARDTGKLYIGDGSNKVLINPDITHVALADKADKLSTARTITIGGDAAGAASFDGSGDITITTTLSNSGVVAGSYAKVTVDSKGRVTAGAALQEADIPSIHLAKISDAGTAASKNTGTAAGNVPVLDAGGKLDAGVLPSIAITDTFPVASQAEMLALTAQTGDVAVRSDLSKSFILKVNDPTVLANWVELKTPTDAVLSVNGKTGAVTVTASDVGLGNVTNESKATMFNDAALTGNSTAVTQAHGDNSTKIATTAFVQDAISVIDGGTF